MTEDEVRIACSVGRRGVCVYRRRVRRAQLVVQSIAIMRGNDAACFRVLVELDSMGMEGGRDGLHWMSEDTPLSTVIDSLAAFVGMPLAGWENFTRSGFIPSYGSPDITTEHFHRSWRTVATQYADGLDLLPRGLSWRTQAKGGVRHD